MYIEFRVIDRANLEDDGRKGQNRDGYLNEKN